MNIQHTAGEELRNFGQNGAVPTAKDALSRFLETNQSASAFADTVRELQSRITPPSAIDQLETQAAQSLKFAEASSLTEKLLNVFGRESQRQSTLKAQAEQAYAQAGDAKRLSHELKTALEKSLGEFVSSTFQLSPNLAELKETLDSFLKREQRRKAVWRAIDRQATELDERLRPKPTFVPAPVFSSMGAGYSGGFSTGSDWQVVAATGPHYESREQEQYRREEVQRVYDRGYLESFSLIRENVCETGPQVERYLSDATYAIKSVDGNFSEAVKPVRDGFGVAGAALVRSAAELTPGQQPREQKRILDGAKDPRDKILEVHESFLKEAEASIKLIADHQRSLKMRVAEYFGISK